LVRGETIAWVGATKSQGGLEVNFHINAGPGHLKASL